MLITWHDYSADIDFKLKRHVRNIRLKGNKRLTALVWMVKFLSFKKRRFLFKALLESQLKYCPLVLMFQHETINEEE